MFNVHLLFHIQVQNWKLYLQNYHLSWRALCAEQSPLKLEN